MVAEAAACACHASLPGQTDLHAGRQRSRPPRAATAAPLQPGCSRPDLEPGALRWLCRVARALDYHQLALLEAAGSCEGSPAQEAAVAGSASLAGRHLQSQVLPQACQGLPPSEAGSDTMAGLGARWHRHRHGAAQTRGGRRECQSVLLALHSRMGPALMAMGVAKGTHMLLDLLSRIGPCADPAGKTRASTCLAADADWEPLCLACEGHCREQGCSNVVRQLQSSSVVGAAELWQAHDHADRACTKVARHQAPGLQ